jgi:hypothetical protein
MSRRRKEEAGIDLFAFQDIVTGTTGILIVITLLMALTLGASRIEQVLDERRVDEAHRQQEGALRMRQQALQAERDKRLALRGEIEVLKEQLGEFLQADIEALKRVKLPDPAVDHQRRLIPPTSASLRQPLTVVARDRHFEVLEDDGTVRRRFDFALGHYRLQEDLLSELEGDHDGFLFLIKPSAFAYCDEITYLGIRDGALLFPFSYDIIPEAWEVRLQ